MERPSISGIESWSVEQNVANAGEFLSTEFANTSLSSDTPHNDRSSRIKLSWRTPCYLPFGRVWGPSDVNLSSRFRNQLLEKAPLPPSSTGDWRCRHSSPVKDIVRCLWSFDSLITSNKGCKYQRNRIMECWAKRWWWCQHETPENEETTHSLWNPTERSIQSY